MEVRTFKDGDFRVRSIAIGGWTDSGFVEMCLKLDRPNTFGDKDVPYGVLLGRVVVGNGSRSGILYIKRELSLDDRSELPSI